jgi:hypothetical protein
MKITEVIGRMGSRLIPSRIRARRNQSLVVREELRLNEGFHGDRHVLELADFFLKQAWAFVETGTLAGTTASYVGKRYSAKVFSCEPDPGAWRAATERCKDYPAIQIFRKQSPDFLYELFEEVPELSTQPVVFWLDAHGYGFRWPLLKEIEFITSTRQAAVIMIDDFKIPGRPEFGFDAYDGQECSLEYILPALNPRHEYRVIVPTYGERTSRQHGLRGVGVIAYGLGPLGLPDTIRAHFSEETLRL